MAEHRLEDRLRALRDDVEWPSTPDLASAVVARVSASPQAAARPFRLPDGLRTPSSGPSVRGGGRPGRRRLIVAVALALLVPVGGAVAFPSARDDVLDWLGLKGAEVRRAPELPPARAPEIEELGRRVTLGEAARIARFRPAVPAALGEPREVRVDPATRTVTLVYDGVLVAQTPGALTRLLVDKVLTTRSGVRSVEVDGARGVFIDGAPHTYLYRRPDGSTGEDRARLAGDTLLFNRGDLLVRVEGRRLALDRALAIAHSLR